MQKDYAGGCHCGAVRYTARLDLDQVISCNCSICSKKGHILGFTDETSFRLEKGKDHLGEYFFHKKKINHLFCKTCGVGSFAQGEDPSGKKMFAINARCLDGVDPLTLKPTQVDGKNF